MDWGKETAGRVAPYFLAGWIALSLEACVVENKFIFYPTAVLVETPADRGLRFDDAFFHTADGLRLHGWFVPYEGSDITLLWFHGNAGNISHRVENLKLLNEKVKINVFIFDYRGYGQSAGRVSEQGTYNDALAALNYLHSRADVNKNRIVFFGRSLGAAVAADLATRADCLALILETPFASIRAMARVAFPLLPVGPLLQTRYDVIEKVKKIHAPLLVVHGDRDEIVPLSQGKTVFEAAPEPKKLYIIRGASHNDTYHVGGDEYFAVFKDFIHGPKGQQLFR